MKLLLSVLLLLSSFQCYSENSKTHEESTDIYKLYELANKQYLIGKYEHARDAYNEILFGMIPEYMDIDLIFHELTEKEQHVFLDAWDGRLRCLAHLDTFHKHHIAERAKKNRLENRFPVLIQNGHESYIKNFPHDDKELEVLREKLKKEGLISKDTDVAFKSDGCVSFYIPKQKSSCCGSCKDGHDKCEGEKKTKKLIPKSTRSCRGHCETAAEVAMGVYGTSAAVSGSPIAVAAGIIAIKALKEKCKACCKGNAFYKNCIRPLEKYFQQPHDSMFPDEDDDYMNNWQQDSHSTWADNMYRRQNENWNRFNRPYTNIFR